MSEFLLRRANQPAAQGLLSTRSTASSYATLASEEFTGSSTLKVTADIDANDDPTIIGGFSTDYSVSVYRIAGVDNPARPDQRIRVFRFNEVDIAGGLIGSRLRVKVRKTVEPVVVK